MIKPGEGRVYECLKAQRENEQLGNTDGALCSVPAYDAWKLVTLPRLTYTTRRELIGQHLLLATCTAVLLHMPPQRTAQTQGGQSPRTAAPRWSLLALSVPSTSTRTFRLVSWVWSCLLPTSNVAKELSSLRTSLNHAMRNQATLPAV